MIQLIDVYSMHVQEYMANLFMTMLTALPEPAQAVVISDEVIDFHHHPSVEAPRVGIET